MKLRGLKALVHEAVDATTLLVREGHESAARVALRVARAAGVEGQAPAQIDAARRLGTDGVLATVRGVNHIVAALTDLALDAALTSDPAPSARVLPMRADVTGQRAWLADSALGALNGVVGDHLARTDNPLDMGLMARVGDVYWRPGDAPPWPPDRPPARLFVLIHGLTATEWSWCLGATPPDAHFGAQLERDVGGQAVYIRYNSGRSVEVNGRELAALLHALVGDVGDAPTIALIGHSMGGLVARAACHQATLAGMGWTRRVELVASLGTPHQGAPLARLGELVTRGLSQIDLPATRIIASILAQRSAGIKDLERGELSGESRRAAAQAEITEVPLLDGVRYAFIASTITEDPAHVAGVVLGDLLVRVDSAQGPRERSATFEVHTAHIGGVNHLALQTSPAVYAQLKGLFDAPDSALG